MNDLATIFSRDPLELTDDDIGQTIAYFRANRHLFNQTPVKTRPKKESAAPANLDINLDDILNF